MTTGPTNTQQSTSAAAAASTRHFISMRRQTQRLINGADFAALQRFEREHPALFREADAPRTPLAQIEAFNTVFDHPVYKAEFMKMIQDIRKQ